MTIRGFSLIPQRAKVACLGALPQNNDLEAFTTHKLIVEKATDENLKDKNYLSSLRAVVFTQNEEKMGLLAKQLIEHAEILLNHDCIVFIKLAESSKYNCRDFLLKSISGSDELRHLPIAWLFGVEAQNYNLPNSDPTYKTSSIPPYIHIIDVLAGWRGIAQEITSLMPDYFPMLSVKIIHKSISLTTEDELLIKRAFWDCGEVYLEQLLDGKSKAMIFIANFQLTTVRGGMPIPCAPRFIKIDSRQQILKEYQNYVERVNPHIPFNLGPNLDKDRCCLAAKKGILVGDYIEESESLLNCSLDNRSVSAIACLFNKTLNNWHHAARDVDTPLTSLLVFPFFKPDRKKRISRAFALGATLRPTALKSLFMKSKTELPVRVGSTHGDLHGNNIRVRETESILIDFCAYKDGGPIIYDAAFLEASLFIDGFSDTNIEPSLLINLLKPLYFEMCKNNNYMRAEYPDDKTQWFFTCVKQIRLYAMQMGTKKQYAATLSIAFLNKAKKDPAKPEPEASVRAIAYVLAELILTTTF